MKRGRYIALEGIEGAGKTTVQRALQEALAERGIEVVTIREPGGTPVGEGIRRLLLEGDEIGPWTEALLFAAQRAQLAEQVIAPALEGGSWVIGDRSVYSSLAYQGGARGLGIAAVRVVNRAGLGPVWPDLVVLLEIDPQAGLTRQEGEDRIGGQGVEFQVRVADAYRELARREPELFAVIDAGRPLGDVTAEVIRVVAGRW